MHIFGKKRYTSDHRKGWNMYAYNESTSTSSYYTYRYKSIGTHIENRWSSDPLLSPMVNPFATQMPTRVWSNWEWGEECFSFSKDKNTMIIWKTSDSENRRYYKRSSVSDLKPNTSFLYD